MLSSVKLYVIAGLGAALLLASVSAYVLYGWYQDAKEEIARLEIVLDKTKANLELVSENLEKENKVRQDATSSLMQLKSTNVEDRDAPLPPAISDTIREFRDRMQFPNGKPAGK